MEWVGTIAAGKLNAGFRPLVLYRGGDVHFEVEKRRQILMLVSSGNVRKIASTSTGSVITAGAIGTPLTHSWKL